jgi:3-hydroxymyristoyl/3-hydroxydecanoyl-(acyl carrier protein) dehydratase
MQPGGRFTVAMDHPSLPGHFPGNPIVPGVVLLDEVLACLQIHGELTLLTAKFTAPVRPGDAVDVTWQRRGDRLDFAGSVGAAGVLRGSAAIL